MVLRGAPWAPESISPTGTTKLGLVVGQGVFACLGCGPGSESARAGRGCRAGGQQPALLAPASFFPGFLTVQHGNPKEAGEGTFHYPAKHREKEDEKCGSGGVNI